MAAIPIWKVYSKDGEYIGSLRSPCYAAPVITMLGDGSTIRYDHHLIVWTEGKESIPALESYDTVEDICRSRAEAIFPGGMANELR
jgi:hypothetical protein